MYIFPNHKIRNKVDIFMQQSGWFSTYTHKCTLEDTHRCIHTYIHSHPDTHTYTHKRTHNSLSLIQCTSSSIYIYIYIYIYMTRVSNNYLITQVMACNRKKPKYFYDYIFLNKTRALYL